MRSSWSLGVLYIALGGLAVSPIGGGHHPLTPVALAIAGGLVLGGVALILQRSFAFWVAIAAASVTVLTGALALAKQPQLALPVPAGLSIGVGLYLILRTFMARSSMGPRRRGFIPHDEAAGDGAPPVGSVPGGGDRGEHGGGEDDRANPA
jgi:hypothetical protein